MAQPYAYATADRAAPPMAGVAAGPYDRAPFHSQSRRGDELDPASDLVGYGPLQPAIPDRTPQVSTELNRLHGLVDLAAANGKLFDELKDRLAPVLRPHPMADRPSNGACQVKQAEPLAPLAADIRDIGERIGDRLHEVNAVLRWLLDALGV